MLRPKKYIKFVVPVTRPTLSSFPENRRLKTFTLYATKNKISQKCYKCPLITFNKTAILVVINQIHPQFEEKKNCRIKKKKNATDRPIILFVTGNTNLFFLA